MESHVYGMLALIKHKYAQLHYYYKKVYSALARGRKSSSPYNTHTQEQSTGCPALRAGGACILYMYMEIIFMY